MKTLQEIKNQYAQEQRYEDWEHLLRKNYWNDGDIEVHWTEICILAQKAALEKAAENARLVPLQGAGFIDFSKQMLDKNSIINEENLIR